MITVSEKIADTLFKQTLGIDLTLNAVLTLSSEVQYMWKRRLTLPAFLFFLLRYTTIVEVVLSLGW